MKTESLEIQHTRQLSSLCSFKIGIVTVVMEDLSHYSVSFSEGFDAENETILVKKPLKITPRKGQEIVLYLYRNSYVHGLDLDGQSIFFDSVDGLEKEYQDELLEQEKFNLKRLEEFKKEQSDSSSEFNRMLARLPKVFKKRFERFFKLGKGFEEYAWYELITCDAAVKIAYGCKSWQTLKQFSFLSQEKQKEILPTIDRSASGAQLEYASLLAFLYLDNPKNVVKYPGALSWMYGSEPYTGKESI